MSKGMGATGDSVFGSKKKTPRKSIIGLPGHDPPGYAEEKN